MEKLLKRERNSGFARNIPIWSIQPLETGHTSGSQDW